MCSITKSFLPFQGLGLYAARDIEKHTMVIEYIGTIIRNEVANRKEKLYESQVFLKTRSICVSSCVGHGGSNEDNSSMGFIKAFGANYNFRSF